MKQLIPVLLILTLLCGCAVIPGPPAAGSSAPTQEPPTASAEETRQTMSTFPVTEATTPTTVPETEAPDPLLLQIDGMSDEELIGQLFLARCPDWQAVEDIARYHLGGYVLFGRDFENETPDSVRQTLQTYQAAGSIPLLIAVDEEGGTVTRVSSEPAFREEAFSSPRRLYEAGGSELILKTELEKSQLLRSLGINVNLAPVCDITTDPEAFMYSRSLGLSPAETGTIIARMVQLMDREKMGSVLKHFPGYGNNTDTHTAMAVDHRPLEVLESEDLVPFQYGIDAGCDAIMVSHVIIQALDDALPASLSPAVCRYLREEMGFDGVIVTDDLSMQAITDTFGAGEAAVLAVSAGSDLLCSSEYALQYQAVLDALREGRISRHQLQESVYRILKWKTCL